MLHESWVSHVSPVRIYLSIVVLNMISFKKKSIFRMKHDIFWEASSSLLCAWLLIASPKAAH